MKKLFGEEKWRTAKTVKKIWVKKKDENLLGENIFGENLFR